MHIEGKHLLVIGGAGLIGSHTVDALLREDIGRVTVFDNFSRGTPKNLAAAERDDRLEVFDLGGDITQPDVLRSAMDGVDGVFHFAALWLLHCERFPDSAFEVNVRGAYNVFRAAQDADVQRLVFSSSASVYGDAVEEPMTEDHPHNNTNFYGATKICGEAMATALHHRYGLPFVGLRYMNVYGPRQDYRGAYIAVMMKMLDALERGEPLSVYGDGSQAYDFVHVHDCAAANVLAMRAEVEGEFYNVGTGRKTTIKELAELLIDLTGGTGEITYEPAGQTWVRNRVGSPAKAEADLGFVAQTDLRDGMRSLIEWRAADRRRTA